MWIVRQVFRCFKCFERSVDRITGVVGPLFIAIAIVLIGTGIVTFFDIIAPKLPFRIITTPICALIAFNTLAHYYWAITISPGFADDDVRLSGQRRHYPTSTWVLKMTAPTRRSSFGSEILPGHELENGRAGKCLKCGSVKPEVGNLPVSCRNALTLVYSELIIAEYASVAYLNMIIIVLVSNLLLTQMGVVIACRLGINQCVGIGNERHFILFMVYLIVCCVCFLVLGFPVAWEVFDMFEPWPYVTPQVAFILIYVICFALGLAVGAMLSWHLYLVARGYSSVEKHDASTYKRVAASRGETFVNAYDLGTRKNFALFFNITQTGHPWWVLLTPLKTLPYTNGHAWIRRHGYEHGHGGIRDEDELTDQEDD